MFRGGGNASAVIGDGGSEPVTVTTGFAPGSTLENRMKMETSCWARLLPLFGVLLAAAPTTHAQTKMYKCIIDGRTVYQQTACPASAQADDVKPTAKATSASRQAASHPSVRPAAHGAKPSTSSASNPTMRSEPEGAQGKAQH
jgi:hypothetical protein